jgi:hypothetical protein
MNILDRFDTLPARHQYGFMFWLLAQVHSNLLEGEVEAALHCRDLLRRLEMHLGRQIEDLERDLESAL